MQQRHMVLGEVEAFSAGIVFGKFRLQKTLFNVVADRAVGEACCLADSADFHGNTPLSTHRILFDAG